ncbi:uncharacterized protein LOC127036726 isoform X2 [Gopherus flavomarginatus]|uniref:uncharacterized protein LOC127036726 isoform X1 n=1 Tax=Gopherus flavomarginatus TaxID=286002 RepID=UPI0021CBE226|nr:uncharacterized protein LOC127036726 isoform X1 [Gopherus flavomarginatus]XP_050783860.1 uncharacterized protein LOC127036726 isoform X2 [Gopherus flavomarginatus]
MGWEQSPREREDREREQEPEEKLQEKQQQRGLVMVEQRDIGGCPGVSGETRLQGRDPGTERTVVVQPQMLRDCGTWVKFPGVKPLALPMAQIPVQTQEGLGWLVVGVLQDIGWEALLGSDCLPLGQDPGPAPVTAEGLNSNPGNQLARMEMPRGPVRCIYKLCFRPCSCHRINLCFTGWLRVTSDCKVGVQDPVASQDPAGVDSLWEAHGGAEDAECSKERPRR